MNIEIERKWIVKGKPNNNLKLLLSQSMRQGYISVDPTVRIREELTTASNIDGGTLKDEYILCFKSHGTLARKEIELSIDKDKFNELEDLINLPLINKIRETYLVDNEILLEVNHVDEGLESEFWYAEIEFESRDKALAFNPKDYNLENYLNNEVTNNTSETMAAYWNRTRKKAF